MTNALQKKPVKGKLLRAYSRGGRRGAVVRSLRLAGSSLLCKNRSRIRGSRPDSDQGEVRGSDPPLPRPSVRVALLLVNDVESRAKEFRDAADYWAGYVQNEDTRIYEVACVEDMITPASLHLEQEISQLVVFGHGTTNGFMRPGKFGVDLRVTRQQQSNYISPAEFVNAWAPVLKDEALVSLACCLCSRSQHWYLTQLYGEIISEWGPEAYEDGGLYSPSAALVRAFAMNRKTVTVRGHCAAGHTIHQALLREHRAENGDGIGRALFRKVFPHLENTLGNRHRWQNAVKGEIAARWLLGLDTLERTCDKVLGHWVA